MSNTETRVMITDLENLTNMPYPKEALTTLGVKLWRELFMLVSFCPLEDWRHSEILKDMACTSITNIVYNHLCYLHVTKDQVNVTLNADASKSLIVFNYPGIIMPVYLEILVDVSHEPAREANAIILGVMKGYGAEQEKQIVTAIEMRDSCYPHVPEWVIQVAGLLDEQLFSEDTRMMYLQMGGKYPVPAVGKLVRDLWADYSNLIRWAGLLKGGDINLNPDYFDAHPFSEEVGRCQYLWYHLAHHLVTGRAVPPNLSLYPRYSNQRDVGIMIKVVVNGNEVTHFDVMLNPHGVHITGNRVDLWFHDPALTSPESMGWFPPAKKLLLKLKA